MTCSSSDNLPRKQFPEGRAAPAPERGLGINTVTVDKAAVEKARKQARRELYADLKTAALILKRHVKKEHRTAKCRWCAISDVELHMKSYGDARRASLKGTVVCGGVWTCPVCAARISRHRRDEMNVMLAWAREKGFVPVLLTLTARHGRGDGLIDLLGRMKDAKQRLRQRAEWRALPFEGSVTATEITHGKVNGWHPHFHELVLLRAESEEEALAMVAPLAQAWRVSLKAFGLDGTTAAFDAQGAGRAGDYVAKWGAAEEMTLSQAKRGREAKRDSQGRVFEPGRTPRELLREFETALSEGNAKRAAWHRDLWLQYVAATSKKRRKQLVWSLKLKDRCGLKELTDQAAAEAEPEEETPPVASWSPREWLGVRSRRVQLMEAAESGGAEAVRRAACGPDDTDDVDPGSLVEEDDGSSPSCHPDGDQGRKGGGTVKGRSDQVGVSKQSDVSSDDSRRIADGGCQSHAPRSEASSPWAEPGYMSAFGEPMQTPATTIICMNNTVFLPRARVGGSGFFGREEEDGPPFDDAPRQRREGC